MILIFLRRTKRMGVNTVRGLDKQTVFLEGMQMARRDMMGVKHVITAVTFIIIICVFIGCGRKQETDVVVDKAIRVFRGHDGWVTSVAFSPDGVHALSSSSDKTVRLWRVAEAREVITFSGHKSRVWSSTFSPNGNYAVSAGNKSVRLWDINTKKQARLLAKKPFMALTSFDRVAFTPDGKHILTSGRLCLRDALTGEKVRDFKKLPLLGIEDFALSPDGTLVVVASWWSKKIQLWDVSTGNKLDVFVKHQGWGNAVTFSPDGRFVLSGYFNGTLILWDVSSGREIRAFKGHTSNIWSVAISPDGRYALSGGDDSMVHLWEISTGKKIKALTGHTPGCAGLSVTFSPDGRYALSGSEDHTLRLWDILINR